jgi:hypothetical protein
MLSRVDGKPNLSTLPSPCEQQQLCNHTTSSLETIQMAYLDSLFPPTTSSMPPSRSTSDGSKKRALPFKAPRPITKTSTYAATTKSTSKTTARNSGAAAASSKLQKRPGNGVSKATNKTTSKSKGKGKQVVISSGEDDDTDELDEEDEQDEAPRSRPRHISISDNDDTDMNDSDSEPAPAAKPKLKAKKRATDPLDEIPGIPPKLLTRLLYEGFEDKDMKIGKDAMAVVGRYIETFVREALARAKAEREEGDGFLQVRQVESNEGHTDW